MGITIGWIILKKKFDLRYLINIQFINVLRLFFEWNSHTLDLTTKKLMISNPAPRVQCRTKIGSMLGPKNKKQEMVIISATIWKLDFYSSTPLNI